MALADLHPHTLAFSQPAQPPALKCRHVDENILSSAILANKTKSFVGFVHFDGTNAFLRRPDLAKYEGRGVPPVCPSPSRAWVHLDHFGDLRALLSLADSDLDPSAFGHAAVSCCLQLTDVDECLGAAGHGDKPKALLGIEPFDDRLDRFRCLRALGLG